VHISLLWTVSGEGIVMLLTAVVSLFSGLFIPLPLFPGPVYAVVSWLPFAGLADLPYRVYTGSIPLSELGLVLARQLAWTLALVALGRWLISRGIRRLVVQGG
jgi:ABC-2 type transport system permease protein